MEHKEARHMVPLLRAGLDTIPVKVSCEGGLSWLVGGPDAFPDEPLLQCTLLLPEKQCY